VTARNCLSSSNLIGFLGDSNRSASVDLNIENCMVSNNNLGISAGSPTSTVRVSNSKGDWQPYGVRQHWRHVSVEGKQYRRRQRH
jgi:hypothetical protein